jgi:hypothetical protein
MVYFNLFIFFNMIDDQIALQMRKATCGSWSDSIAAKWCSGLQIQVDN